MKCGCWREHSTGNNGFKYTVETDQSHDTTHTDQSHGLPHTDQSYDPIQSDQSHDKSHDTAPTDSLHNKLPVEVVSVSAHSQIIKTPHLNQDSTESPALCQSKKGIPHYCDCLVVPSTDGWLYILDTSTGHCLTKSKLPGEVFSSPVVLNNHILVGCRDNFLYSFDVT